MDSDGTVTCFAANQFFLNTTCRVRPQVQGTATARVGYAFGPAGHTLAYIKGGAAWVHDRVDLAMNNALAPFIPALGLPITSNSQNLNLWGGTVGVGIEQALTPAWSLKVEYDYLGLGRGNVTNLGSPFVNPTNGALIAFAPPSSSGVTQNLHEMKIGLNYKIGADPSAGWFAPAYPVEAKAPPPPVWLPGWEFEAGGRYFGSWGQFHKDLGQFVGSGVPSISSISRLTYDGLQTNAGEFFGRVDSPWNLFLKGFVGGGKIRTGHMNDEDFGIPFAPVIFELPYSNTLSTPVTGNTTYGAVDGGFDVKRGPDYKIGLFAGYFWFNEKMNTFGCTVVAGFNCIPPVPSTGSAIITENDKWQAVRLGVSGETMLTDRVKLSGEVAYLPWVKLNGVDQHFFGNTGILASNNPESGNGRGVQLEALLSYYITPQFSVGVGGRYWGLWTSTAQANRDFDATGIPTPTPPQYFKGVVEQAGVLVQASYRFGAPGVVVAKY
jgi:hypothetical protein